MAWLTQEKRVPGAQMWEIYLTDPAQEPDPAKWRTQICWPVSAAAVAAPVSRSARASRRKEPIAVVERWGFERLFTCRLPASTQLVTARDQTDRGWV